MKFRNICSSWKVPIRELLWVFVGKPYTNWDLRGLDQDKIQPPKQKEKKRKGITEELDDGLHQKWTRTQSWYSSFFVMFKNN